MADNLSYENFKDDFEEKVLGNKKKLIMMVRDRGHALSIEITLLLLWRFYRVNFFLLFSIKFI